MSTAEQIQRAFTAISLLVGIGGSIVALATLAFGVPAALGQIAGEKLGEKIQDTFGDDKAA